MPQLFRPRTSVAGTDVKQIRVGIVRHAVPYGAPAAELPPLAFPGRGSFAHSLVLKTFGWIARDRVEFPRRMPGFRIEGLEESAHWILRARDADDHFALGD